MLVRSGKDEKVESKKICVIGLNMYPNKVDIYKKEEKVKFQWRELRQLQLHRQGGRINWIFLESKN